MIKNKTGDSTQSVTVDSTPKNQAAVVVVPKANTNLTVNSEQDLIGYWVGLFKPDTTENVILTGEQVAWDFSNKINISIDSIR